MSKQTLIPKEAFINLVDRKWVLIGTYLRLNPQLIPAELLILENLNPDNFREYCLNLIESIDENLVDIKKLIKFSQTYHYPHIPEKYKGIDIRDVSIDGFLFVNKPLDLENDDISLWTEKVLSTEPLISVLPLIKSALSKKLAKKDIEDVFNKRKDLTKPIYDLADWINKLEDKITLPETPSKKKWFNI